MKTNLVIRRRVQRIALTYAIQYSIELNEKQMPKHTKMNDQMKLFRRNSIRKC